MRIIECPICGNSCGKEFPADDTDPAFREGKGENFSLPDGTWFCSPECLDEFISSTDGRKGYHYEIEGAPTLGDYYAQIFGAA